MNKFQEMAESLYQLQAKFTNLPPEVYVTIQQVMFELQQVKPLTFSEINHLISQIDSNKSPSLMIIDLLRLTEKEHKIV